MSALESMLVLTPIVEELAKRNWMPMLVIGGDKENVGILPCCPVAKEKIYELLRNMLAEYDAGKVVEIKVRFDASQN